MKTPPSPNDPTPKNDWLDAFLAASRAERPDTSRAEYGFETRLLARLAAERAESAGWRELTIWCWRLLPCFAVLTLGCALWTVRPDVASSDEGQSLVTTAQPLPGDDDDLAQWMAVEWLAPI